jgi:hypothetical protein
MHVGLTLDLLFVFTKTNARLLLPTDVASRVNRLNGLGKSTHLVEVIKKTQTSTPGEVTRIYIYTGSFHILYYLV